ncbi:hypothetical protein AB0D30_37190, partial [Streptomyces sp. NPDC048409]
MSTNLKDKTVLVVGRGSGIARAVSAAVLAEGGRVVGGGGGRGGGGRGLVETEGGGAARHRTAEGAVRSHG